MIEMPDNSKFWKKTIIGVKKKISNKQMNKITKSANLGLRWETQQPEENIQQSEIVERKIWSLKKTE